MLGLMGSLENKRSVFIFKVQPCIYFLWAFRILLPVFFFTKKKAPMIECRDVQVENRLNGRHLQCDDDDADFYGFLVEKNTAHIKSSV